MRRLLHYTLNVITVLSLLLCVATVALWVRSYWRGDTAYKWDGADAISVSSRRGGIDFERVTMPQPFTSDWQWLSSRDPPPGWRFANHWLLGFGYRNAAVAGGRVADVIIPYWAILVAATLLPAIVLHRRRRRHQPGLCPACGYDLRATPDRCPECGRIPDTVSN